MSFMEIGIRALRTHTAEVIAAIESGERVTLTDRGSPVAEIVPHDRRERWLSGERLTAELSGRAADPGLTADLSALTDHS